MSTPTIVAIVFDAVAFILFIAAASNLADYRHINEHAKADDLLLGIFKMTQACAELMMAFVVAAAGAALSQIVR